MSLPDSAELQVEVVYALPEHQELVTVELGAGATVQQAIEKSSIADLFADHDLENCQVGIWGHIVDRQHAVRHGDRVEIYRELPIDPRDARRSLATIGQTMGRRKA